MTKGRAEGEAAIRAELEAFYRDRFERAVSLVEKTVSGLDRARESLAALQEPQMVRLWEALLSRMLVTRVTLDPDTVLRTVAELLKRLSDRERVLVYLHPEDIARVEGRPELTDLLRGIKRLEYLADSHVDPGSVLIETNLGVYDARWRTQLEQVAAEVDHLLLTGGEDDGGERPA
jgi:flagellar assembly protein FliH